MDKFHRIVTKEMLRYGFECEVIRQNKGAYNPLTSSVDVTETRIPCRAMIFDLTLQSNGDYSKLGTLIQSGDKQILIQPNLSDGYYYDEEVIVLEPNKDYVQVGNKKYKIVTFKQLNPSSNEAVIWDCYVRL